MYQDHQNMDSIRLVSDVYKRQTQWCQLAPDQMISPAVNPPPSGRYLTKINLGASRIDTTYVCGEEVYDTVGIYKGVIQPGQTRGIALYGMNGAGFYYVTGAVAPCGNTIQGNGVLGIDVRNGRSTRGNAIPFNQPLTFSIRMFNGDLCYLTEPVNTIPVKQTCGLPSVSYTHLSLTPNQIKSVLVLIQNFQMVRIIQALRQSKSESLKGIEN